MSRTLFWYVFKDLVKIFFMASGALAGIMSFGGLLRPLTQNGLDGSQVILLLRYFMPAMSTYSLPVAALFATTAVYGRMSADNELTACRASGISFLSIATPAMLLGLLVSIGSMFLLCFSVPNATLKIEQVLVSNIAKIIQHQIEQTHQIKFDTSTTIFAQDAYLPDPDPSRPHDASVFLKGPLIVSYYTPAGKDKYFHTVKQFYMAESAIAYIHEDPTDGSASLRATLTNGVVFPRRFVGPKSEQGGVASAEFGPQPIPSRLSEKAKFMDIFQLKKLDNDPYQGREVRKITSEFITEDQSNAYCEQLSAELNGPEQTCTMVAGAETYIIKRSNAPMTLLRNTITVTAAADANPLLFTQQSGGQTRLNAQTRNLRITVDADTEHDQFFVSLDLNDTLVDAGDMPSPQAHLGRHFAVPMPPGIAAIKNRTAQNYLEGNVGTKAQRQRLVFSLVDLVNHLRAEMHSRAAFVVSCLLLVLVGAALGMMFKSGNFLNAFAVSVVPAMFSMVLIVSGQHTAQAIPLNVTDANNPLFAGLAIIWFSNIATGIAAFVLLFRLQRQ